ncbi:Glutathione S-transferase [Musa troglodytarum]|uniref:Glutathione S-transferase n=1 Tax=Musa troglodytarum TaxID=320322 RepID=A0A9E7GW53_9LILI|nr:Glutathione S-transferase [Musa troglodytarum]
MDPMLLPESFPNRHHQRVQENPNLLNMATVKVFGSPTTAELQRRRDRCPASSQEIEFQLTRVDNHRGQRRLPERRPLFTWKQKVYRWWEAISSRPLRKRVVQMQQEPPRII